MDSQGPVPLQVEPLLGLKKKSINANVVNVLNLTMFKLMFFLIIQKKISKTDKVTLGAEIAFLVTKLQLMTRRVRWILWLLEVLITEVEEIFWGLTKILLVLAPILCLEMWKLKIVYFIVVERLAMLVNVINNERKSENQPINVPGWSLRWDPWGLWGMCNILDILDLSELKISEISEIT